MIHTGDAIEVMRGMSADSVDAVVTDPPAGVHFMSKNWDHDKGGRTEWVAWMTEVMRECHRLLKPGGYAVVWSLPRTCHWTAWAMEDAGFTIRDQLAHIFASGFPKGKAQLKPAREDWWLARKPGPLRPLNIEETRIPGAVPQVTQGVGVPTSWHPRTEPRESEPSEAGRWPSNLLLSDPELFDEPNPQIIGSGGVEDGSGYSRFFTIPQGKEAEGCWPWTGATDDSGYGRFGRGSYAHRMAWETVNGPIPEGMHVLHHCDNPPCVRPDHLWLGTHADNMADMAAKGRGRTADMHGEDRYNSKLTDEIVREARRLHAEGSTFAALEARFGINQRVISKAVRGISWQHVADDPEHPIGYIIPKADRADREPIVRGQLESALWSDGREVAADYPSQRGKTSRENGHPTVKPTDLMRHLVRLVTPIGGTVLDCFAGSGSTLIAAEMEGFAWIGIEQDASYVAIAEARLNGTQRGLGLDVGAPTKPPAKAKKYDGPGNRHPGNWPWLDHGPTDEEPAA